MKIIRAPLLAALFAVRHGARRRIGRARLRALPRLGHLRARRNRRLACHAAVELARGQLRDPQEQPRGDRPRHASSPASRPRSKRSSTSPAWCTSKSPRTRRARSRARSAPRWRPRRSQPSIPAPADFDAFWTAKIAALRKVPAKPELTEKPSEKDGVDFAILQDGSPRRQTRLGPGGEAARPDQQEEISRPA